MKETKARYLLLLFFFFQLSAISQQINIPLLQNEKWWGGAVAFGADMPFDAGASFSYDLLGDLKENQSASLLMSNKGRWIWSEDPIKYSFNRNRLEVVVRNASIDTGTAGATLASAYRYVSKKYFPTKKSWPDSLLIKAPQYNLWIELQYNPTQEKTQAYADSIISNGLPPGVLMIDDNWSNYYGAFEFNKEKFPDPASLMHRLHSKGFKTMLWVCPFISADSEAFRFLSEKKYLLLDNEGNGNLSWNNASKPMLIRWWNGYSACLDLTNPGAQNWLRNKLFYLQKKYGVDGFKLDAGDAYFYNAPDMVSFRKVKNPNEHTEEWLKMGLSFPLNEYRAAWKMGGEPLVQRLADKKHDWKDLQSLIPNTIAQQLLGYTFTCPDMIGGGQIGSFMEGAIINQKLMVRSAQVHALMPMMQFSVAPWRVLNAVHLDAVKKAVALRNQLMPEIMKAIKDAAETGEPALRPLEYNYPNQGFSEVKDMFMIGNKILVAPIVTDKDIRQVTLPHGQWMYNGKKMLGGKTYTLTVALNELLVFTRTAYN